MNQTKRKVLGGGLLVAGTSIGAGMLGLPISTGVGGFWPAVFIFCLCWLFSTSTGFLLLEISLKMPRGANLISMSEQYLGKFGKFCSWILYLFLFYCLSVAYIAVGGPLLVEASGEMSWLGSVFFTVFLGFFVYVGAKYVDRINFWLMVGLIGTYLAFLFFGAKFVQPHLLAQASWFPASLALPVIFTSFSYQGIVPSLTHYLQSDARKVRQAILLGTSIAFVVYIVWEVLILGMIPVKGSYGLFEAQRLGEIGSEALKYHTGSEILFTIQQYFAFFAIATSFLGVNLGLFDFLSDGLKISKRGWGKVWLAVITFIPPLFIALSNPHIFLTALGYAGGVGAALLLGLIPILMVWVARYRRKEMSGRQLIGGRFLLVCLIVFVLINLWIQLGQEFGWL